MSSAIQEFHDYIVHDVMATIPDVTSKRMFGGYGLYQDGAIFAIITSDSELYFKTDDTLKETFKEYRSHPFIYTGHKKRGPVEMSYWLLPEEIMEDREKLEKWINASAEVSRKSKKI